MAALVGGFAAALVTGGLAAWREHVRSRRALRVAARLVAGELRTVESRLHLTVASGSWRDLSMRSLAQGEWDEHRELFAARLSLSQWTDLCGAYQLVAAVNSAAQSHQASERLTEVERELLETAARAAETAAALVEPRPSHRNGPRGASPRSRTLVRYQ